MNVIKNIANILNEKGDLVTNIKGIGEKKDFTLKEYISYHFLIPYLCYNFCFEELIYFLNVNLIYLYFFQNHYLYILLFFLIYKSKFLYYPFLLNLR